jgi:hypothetical protein
MSIDNKTKHASPKSEVDDHFVMETKLKIIEILQVGK